MTSYSEKEKTFPNLHLTLAVQEEPKNEIQHDNFFLSNSPSIQSFDCKNAKTRKFLCPISGCVKSYGKSSHLRSHLTWHSGIKPFVCKIEKCGKSFTRSDELTRHTRTHTGEKRYTCEECFKKFSRSDHLTKHIATHNKTLQRNNRRRRPSSISKSKLKTNIIVIENGNKLKQIYNNVIPFLKAKINEEESLNAKILLIKKEKSEDEAHANDTNKKKQITKDPIENDKREMYLIPQKYKS